MLAGIWDHAIFSVDPHGQVSSWSPGAERCLGYREAEILGRPLSVLYPPEEAAREALRCAAQEGRFAAEGWLSRKDGSRYWGSVSLGAIRGPEGRVSGHAVVMGELSQRHATEVALAKTEAQMRLLIDSVSDYAIFMLDTGGNVVTWNPGAERLKGYAADEIIGRHVSTFYPEESRAAGLPWRLLSEARTKGRVENEGWRVRKNGERFWANVVISAIRGPDGTLRGFSKVTRELTAHRKAEEELRRSEQRFRLLLESVKDYAIFMLDLQGRVITWNAGAEQLKGYSADEVLGRHFSLFYTDEDRRAGKAEQELRQAAEEGRYEEEGWRVRKDGSRFWANVVLTAIRGTSGELMGFAKVTRDLTDRHRAEEERFRLGQAREALRLRDEFLSIAAHELRTPLTALQMGLQSIAKRSGELDEQLARKVVRVTRASERLSALVESLFDVARISAGRLELHRSRVNVVQIAQDVGDLLADAAARAGCDLEVDAQGVIDGEWDRLRVEQILVNLLGNAFKYAPRAPVRLSVRTDGDDAVLRIEDHGPGLPEADLHRIFDRFERATTMQSQTGLGLGLYVTLQLVHAHGGTIVAENMDEGGLRFTVRLPRRPPLGAEPLAG